MQSKNITIAIFTIMFLFGIFLNGAVNAQTEGTTSPEREGERATRQDRLKTLRENEVKKTERGTTSPKQIDGRRISLIKNFFKKMHFRHQAAISRLERISAKIKSRIEKFEKSGMNVGEAKIKLEIANGKILEAKAALSEIEPKLDEALSGENPKEAFAAVREDLLKSVSAKIREAHQALVDVVRILKAAGQR